MANPGNEISSLDFKNIIGGPLIAVVEAQAQAALSTVNYIKSVGFDADGKVVNVSFLYPKEVYPYRPGNKGQVVQINNLVGGAGYSTAPSVTFSAAPASGRTATGTAVISGGVVTGILITDPGEGYTGNPTVTIGTPPAVAAAAAGGGTPTPPAPATATTVIGTDAPKEAVYREMELKVPILTMLPIPYLRIEEVTIDFNVKINSMETYSSSDELNIGGSLEFQQGWGSGSVKLNVSASYKRTTAAGTQVERTYDMAVHVRAVQDETPGGLENILGILEQAVVSTPTKKVGA
jgi:hypothetical protein